MAKKPKKPAAKRKRLVRGRDWHGWCLKRSDGSLENRATALDMKNDKRWVRVKFVEVKL